MRVQIRFEGAENPINALCNRYPDGARPSIRVWCSHVGAPADGNADGTRCQRRTTLGLTLSGKKWKNPLVGKVCLLTTGVLIRVRLGPCSRLGGGDGSSHDCPSDLRVSTTTGTS